MKKIMMIICLQSIFSSTLFAQTPRAFYIGHSLSDQIPDMVKSLSDDHPDVEFDWVYQTIPGAPLRWQWNRINELDYNPIEPHFYGFYEENYGLPTGDFDILVLTEAVPRYWAIIDETYAYADSFYQYATSFNPDTKVYLYEDWHCILSGTPTDCDYDVDSNPWRQRLTDDLAMWESVVDSLNTRHNPSDPVCLIPVGQGLAALYDSIEAGVVPDLNSIEDIFSDNIHLTDVGKYYVACIHFAMIHGVNPTGLTNQLQVWWGGDFDPPSPELALKFQEMAWETVVNYPKTCLDISTDQEEEQALNFAVYPTLFTDQLTTESSAEDFRGQLFNLTGKLRMEFSGVGGRSKVDFEQLELGVYVLRLVDARNDMSEVLRVVKF